MPRSIRTIPPARRQLIERKLREGLTITQVAAEVKCDRRLVGLVREAIVAAENADLGLSSKPSHRLVPEPKLMTQVVQLLPPPVQHLPSPRAADVAKLSKAREGERKRRSLQEMRRHLRRGISLKERALGLIDLAKDKNSFIRMRALERMDEIDGINQQAKENAPEKSGPMIMFPPGTGVSFAPVSVPTSVNSAIVVNPVNPVKEEEEEK